MTRFYLLCLAFMVIHSGLPAKAQHLAMIDQGQILGEPPKEKMILLADALDQLSVDHQVFFTYEMELVAGHYVLTDPQATGNVDHALRSLLAGSDLAYNKVGDQNYIIHKANRASASLPALPDSEQTTLAARPMRANWTMLPLPARSYSFLQPDEFSVRGTVTNAEGEAMIGVNVLVKNTTIGTVTDVDGNYEMSVPDDTQTLVFSYTGYQPQEVEVEGRSVIDVVMQESASMLNEVVVVGYGTQIKRDVTGSVSRIESKELQSFNASSVDQQLQGLASGVQVTSTAGVPGAPVRVMVRGTNSIFSGTEPLWVIDGMILQGQGGGELTGFSRNASTTPFNPLATLNPNDIESIEVLKDAAATAVYGSRGANGVIIVTTKSGKRGRGGLDLAVNYGFTDPVRGPEEIGFVDGPTWLALADESRANRGFPPFDPNEILNVSRDPTAVLDRSQTANTNWFDEALRRGQVTDINVSSSRGTENLNYYLSGNYRNEQSILVGDKLERYSLRTNVDYDPIENLTVGARINLSYSDRERAPNGGAPGGNSNIATGGYNMANSGALPILPVFHPTITDPTGSPILFDPLSGRNLRATLNRDNYINDVETYRALAGLQVEYRLPWVQGLSLRSEVAADIIHSSNIEWGNTVIREDSKYGFDNATTFHRLNYNLYASFNRTFGIHSINAVLGTESTEQGQRSRNIEAQQLFGQAQQIGGPADVQRVSNGYGGEVYFRGYFSRLNYKLLDRYLLGLSYRRDGSSIFQEDFRWGDFLALSGGWIISSEPFMEGSTFINFLKLRGSFGQTGNSAISNTATETTYTGWGRYGDVGAGDLLTGIGNSAVTWETTDAVDGGVDFELWGGRVNGSFGYYQQNVKDMLFQVPIPSSSGIFSGGPTIWQNVGDMRNWGWEIELGAVVVDRPTFDWKVNVNFTTNQNEVTRLASEEGELYNVRSNPLVTRVGDPIGFFRIARYAGVHPEGGYELIREMDLEHFAATGEQRETGRLIPATRANLTSHLFDHPKKTGLPKWFGGVSSTFTWRGFELFALVNFSGGNYIYDLAAAGSSYVNGAGIYREDIVGNYWTPNNRDADLPALSWDRRYDVIEEDGTISQAVRFDNQRAGQVHDKWLQKGDFARLRTLSLSYTVPRSFAQQLKLQNIRLGIMANNLLTITGYDGYDPEVVNLGGAQSRNLGQGWVGIQLPQVRTVNFMLNLGF